MSQAQAAPPATVSATTAPRFRGRGITGDTIFENGVLLLALVAVLLIVGIVGLLFTDARAAIGRYGFAFLSDSVWDPVFEKFGAAAFIFGTVVTSLIALLIATPIALGASIYLSDYAPDWLREPLAFLIELLAAIPSIIYGLWGFFVFAPFMRTSVERFLKDLLTPIPGLNAFVEGPPIGKDILVAGLILAIMILPTILSIARQVLRAVPQAQREGMLALGATKWEMIQKAVLPSARAGVLAAALLGLARALGETMAVTLVIGNSSTKISASLFTPGYTIASVIANQFTEADKEIYFSAIVELALVLMLVAIVMNVLARALIGRVNRGAKGARA
ncbi:MAG: phosphate ABC transporter permease subunit PstC [Chloroflexota bacterium]